MTSPVFIKLLALKAHDVWVGGLSFLSCEIKYQALHFKWVTLCHVVNWFPTQFIVHENDTRHSVWSSMYLNNEGAAAQPARPRNLVSAFVKSIEEIYFFR